MNEQQLNALLRAARRVPPPVAEPGFEHRVLTAVRREAGRGSRERESLFPALGALLPRVAWATAAVVALCAAAEVGAGALGLPNLTEGLAQLSDQWLPGATDF
jgi:hypothetical protein